jgi:hypothetical protein
LRLNPAPDQLETGFHSRQPYADLVLVFISIIPVTFRERSREANKYVRTFYVIQKVPKIKPFDEHH